MDMLLTSLPQLLKLYIEDFVCLLEFFSVFITVFRVVRILSSYGAAKARNLS
jgi:hypothetical protein